MLCVNISERSRKCNFKQTKMKKIISVILLVFMMTGIGMHQAPAADRKLDTADLASVVSRYENEEGFEIVNFSNLSMGLIKLIANLTASEEDKKALDVLDGINKFVVINYYDAPSAKKTAFNKELSAILDGVEKIIEVKDSGDSVDIYGSLSKDGETIENVVIHASDGGSLVCFFGRVRAQDLGEIAKMTND